MSGGLVKVARQLVAAACLVVAGWLSPVVAEAQEVSAPEADFEAFWALYDENYALFEVKQVDWDAVYRIYRPQVTEGTSREALFDIFTEVTCLLNDVHVTVEDETSGAFSRSGARSLGTGPFETGEFSLSLITQNYVQGELESRANGAMAFGWLPGNIGYLRIATFKYPETSASTMHLVMARFAGARGMIIDVRQNGGGSDLIGRDIASRFAKQAQIYMHVTERVSSENDDAAFNKEVSWTVPAKGGEWAGKPVIVLTNSRSISAAENFVIAMKTLPNALIVGDVTAGVMADAHRMPAGDGWRFGVPVNVLRDRNGVSWEGIGVVPDYWVRNSPEDIALGEDRVLDFALSLIEAGPEAAPRRRVSARTQASD